MAIPPRPRRGGGLKRSQINQTWPSTRIPPRPRRGGGLKRGDGWAPAQAQADSAASTTRRRIETEQPPGFASAERLFRRVHDAAAD